MVIIKSPREIAAMREAGRIVAMTLREMGRMAVPGVTTGEMGRFAEDYIIRQGGVPAFKGYRGFPASACISVNDQVVHGIPGERELREGDIVSIDVGVILDGYHGDGAWTFSVGNVSEEARRLLKVTYGALLAGIAVARPGNRVGDVSHAVEQYVVARGMSVVRDYVGHGIGRAMHEEPQVPNFGPPGVGVVLRPGMTLAIEPMVNVGRPEVRVLSDGWTVVTADGSLSAHFEHTVAIGDGEPEILTRL